jgi:putative DNA primase/helicase
MIATVTPIRRDATAWKKRLVTKQNRRGDDEIVDCNANATTIFRSDTRWEGCLAWNELSQGIVCRRPAPWFPDDLGAKNEPEQPWSETDAVRAQNWLQRAWSVTVSEQTAYKAALLVAEARPYDPLREMVMALEWDEKPRLDRWLTTYLGVEDTEYSQFVGRITLIGGMARALRPGCKFDTMLILEGTSGLFKSQAVRILIGDAWVRDTPVDLKSNDRFLSVRGCWCREWAELDGFGKADAVRVKSFLSSQCDDFRAPYGRGMIQQERRCFFIGTTNPPQLGYLVDEEGNRRMLPVECGKVGGIDLAGLERDRVPLLAEARRAYQAGEKWWATTPALRALCNQEQDQRMVAEVWEGKISTWLATHSSETTVREVLSTCLGVPVERHDKSNAARVGHVLARCGWYQSRRGGSGDRERYYARRVEAPPVAPTPPDDDIERSAIQAQAAE